MSVDSRFRLLGSAFALSLVLSTAPADAGQAPPLSGAVVLQVDLLRLELPTLGLEPAELDWLMDKLDVVLAAAERGSVRSALHASDQVADALADVGAPPHVTDMADVLGAMIIFESLVAPVLEAPAVVDAPASAWQLLAWLADDADRDGADLLVDECVAVAEELLSPAMLFGESGGGVGDLKITTADKRILKAYALDLWDDVRGKSSDESKATSERKDGGLADVGSKKADTPVAKRVLSPRCEIDQATLGGDPDNFKSSITSMGLNFGYTWEWVDWSATVSGSVDVTEPFGPMPGWRCGLDFELFKPGGFSVTGGLDVDSEGRVRGRASARIDF